MFILGLIITLSSHAQLCQGSLGDAVVNITFGAGQNPGPPLSAATTNYQYVSYDCPNDGMYTIINKTSACWNDTWHSLISDHTGNPNGYFMLVNASFSPSDFFIDTIHGLCANTTFEFAAWLLNILKPSSCNYSGILPNLTFKIETTAGTVLQSFNTGTIGTFSEPTWKQYGFYFKTPTGVNDVVIRMTNNAPGGCGNDIALDDITLRACGPTVKASITNGNTTMDICEGKVTTLTFNSTVSAGYANPSLQWQQSMDGINWADISGATNSNYTTKFSTAGNYFYRLTVAEGINISLANCRVASNIITININKNPVPMATNNGPGCFGKNIILSASNGVKYNWKGPNNFSDTGQSVTLINPSFFDSGKYYVTVISDKGCIGFDSTIVAVNPAPTAFAGNDANICEGNFVQLNASGNGTYNWSPADGLSSQTIPNPIASPTDSIQYIFTVTNQFGCADADTININVFKKPIADAGEDKAIIQYQSVQLNGKISGTNVTYYWSPNIYIDNENLLQPTVNPPRDTTYVLHVTSNVGCGSAVDEVFIKVYPKILIPNAFSPNHDGINDKWKIVALDNYPNAEISVFNRYGQIVFHSIGYNKPWNGKYNDHPLPVGTYYYVIDLKTTLFSKLSGWVEILR